MKIEKKSQWETSFYYCLESILREQENPLNKRSGGYFYRSIVKLTTDTLCNVENE
jgi:hypothetical protein